MFITIIIIVVALVVALMLPYIAKAYASGDVVLRTAAARDIALTMSMIYAYPYDMDATYDFDLSKFLVEISENKVTVGKDLKRGSKYSFAAIGDDKPGFILRNPKKIIFEKEDGKFKCSYYIEHETNPEAMRIIECEKTTTGTVPSGGVSGVPPPAAGVPSGGAPGGGIPPPPLAGAPGGGTASGGTIPPVPSVAGVGGNGPPTPPWDLP